MPTRTDLIIEPPLAPDTDRAPLMEWTVWANFRINIHSWLSYFSSVSRLAFGGVLATRPNDPPATASLLTRMVGFEITPDTRDFIYQINRRTRSETEPSLLVNRLSRWQMIRLSTLSIDLQDPAVIQEQGESPPHAELTLDINTVPERDKHIPAESLAKLFSELMAFGERITEHGVHDA